MRELSDDDQVCRTHVEGRAVTRTPDVVKEMRRGSMKERWGLELVYRLLDAVTLEIAVTKVSRPSAAHAAGLSPGHVITVVNQWNVEVSPAHYTKAEGANETTPHSIAHVCKWLQSSVMLYLPRVSEYPISYNYYLIDHGKKIIDIIIISFSH